MGRGESDEQLERAREDSGIKGGSGSDILWSDMQLVVLASVTADRPRGNGKIACLTLSALDALLFETNPFPSTASSPASLLPSGDREGG